jgi:GNAT superfamily N-acetyltransferase
MVTYRWIVPERISPEDAEDINALLCQLTDSPRRIDLADIREIAEKSLWLVARNEQGRIKGMATLTISRIPTGSVGHLDDIVVDVSLRGQHIGEGLVKRMIECVRIESKADRIELTCKPGRIEANGLYAKLGFQKRETNCYMLKI